MRTCVSESHLRDQFRAPGTVRSGPENGEGRFTITAPCGCVHIGSKIGGRWTADGTTWLCPKHAIPDEHTDTLNTKTVRPADLEPRELRETWDRLDSPVLRVIDEQGVNVAGAQVRQLGGEWWLYVDDIDGYSVLNELDGDLVYLILIREEDYTPLGWDEHGNVIEL